MRRFLAIVTATLMAASASAQQHIAPTEPKSPADERASFKVPAGFEVQLVAAEPDIEKPIQIAFDAMGRLWATTTHHYPFAAEPGKASDRLYVLSDFGPDGKAKKITLFADDLNIPIGILPLPDCKSCLVSEVGRILKLTDTNGDGKADKRETLLSGFGTDDTHGMMNSFILLPDGWVYATHGFRNNSVVKGTDGSEIRMQSGNTFRFRPDGTQVQNWTFGQVNPFGMTVDPYMNFYTADCHSKPITQLIRGAYYQSFGKPHDGLGFAPHVTDHSHGSTALCGLAWYDAPQFPPEYRNCMFLGNVVTNRVNADRIEFQGGTPVAKELPDFLTSSDPWFRPTDIKLGQDGALYVADFYNRIIGHYEVDLKHPQRDKERGRIWRIVWKGLDGKAPPPTMPRADWTTAKYADIGGDLASPNITVRLTAANELARRWKADPTSPQPEINLVTVANTLKQASIVAGLLAMVGEQTGVHVPDTDYYAHLVREMKKQGEAEQLQLTGMMIRGLGSRATWGATERGIAAECITGFANAHLRRAAVDGMIGHPHADNIAPLVKLLRELPADDSHLRFAARVALRNALRDGDGWSTATKLVDSDEDRAVIADIALGVAAPAAAKFLLGQIEAGRTDPRLCEHVGRYGDDTAASAVVGSLKGKPAELAGLLALARGAQTRGAKLPANAIVAATAACERGLTTKDIGTVQTAAELAAGLKLTTLFDTFAKIATTADANEGARAASLGALTGIDPAKGIPIVAATLSDAAAAYPLREKAAQVLGAANSSASRAALLDALKTAPARLASNIGQALTGSPAGATALLDAVQQGKASPTLLQDKAVAANIGRHDGGKFRPRVAELTKGLPSVDAKLAELLRKRTAGFVSVKPVPALGLAVFTKNCAACHQLGGQGAKVGPQLDGIGNRGTERVLEDLLDPNRNVDHAFRTTVLNLADGRTLSGLLLREEGQILVLADNLGKEVRVPMKDIDKRSVSPLSPMPANFDTSIPEADFYQLLGYLLSQRTPPPK